jgi:hypothetical protein
VVPAKPVREAGPLKADSSKLLYNLLMDWHVLDPIYAAGPPQASLEERAPDAGKPQQPPPPRDTAPAPERPRAQRPEWPLRR